MNLGCKIICIIFLLDKIHHVSILTLLFNFLVDADLEKIEVDPLNRRLFYADTGNNQIGSLSLDGSDFRIIINSGLGEPRDVVSDPRNRLVFFFKKKCYAIERPIEDFQEGTEGESHRKYRAFKYLKNVFQNHRISHQGVHSASLVSTCILNALQTGVFTLYFMALSLSY